MLTVDDICGVFTRPGDNHIGDVYRAVLSSTRIHAPVQAYVMWITALKEISGWTSDVAARAQYKTGADNALLNDADFRTPNRWQKCVALITQAVWVTGTASPLNTQIMARFASGTAAPDIIQLIVRALAELYVDEAELLPSGPCSFFYLAQAASLVDGVVAGAGQPVAFYLQTLQQALAAATVVNGVPDDPNRLPRAANDLQKMEQYLTHTSRTATAALVQIDNEVARVGQQKTRLEAEVQVLQDQIAQAEPETLGDLQARLTDVVRSLESLQTEVRRQVKLTRVLKFLQTRLRETRDSLDEKAAFVARFRTGGIPSRSSPNPGDGFRLRRWLHVALSGNPRQMTPAGWLRFACLAGAAVLVLCSIVVLSL
jgi:hypothetical protein